MLDSFLEHRTAVNLINGPLGVVENRNSVEIITDKSCWVPKLSYSMFARENVITWN